MSYDEPPTTSQEEQLPSRSRLWIWLLPLLALFGLILFLTLGGKSSPTTTRTSEPGQAAESGLETARQTLTRQNDVNGCRNALQQINTEMGEKPTLRPPSLTDEQRAWLHDHLSLSAEELKEVETNHYTRLDNHYVFGCFLLRDVAYALEIKGARGKGAASLREKPLEQAARAFAWVMREVRLRQHEEEPVPPAFALRRGWGNALERALVFLALLQQLGDPGAAQPELRGVLLQLPKDDGSMRLWACGVVVGEDKDVYLFDPHLGLPLPGPRGEGIATLAQAREQPDVLTQLDAGEKLHYPVTAEQARKAQAHLVCPLSALAPRMRYLQEKLLAPVIRLRLAVDPAADFERIKTACTPVAANPVPAVVSKDLCTLLRRFLPTEEGGADTTMRMARSNLELVPWKTLPAWLRDERVLVQKSDLANRIRNLFAIPFLYPMMEPGQSRDLLLRGRYSSAVPALVSERERWNNQMVQRANAVDLEEKIKKWLDQANGAYADLYRARGTAARQQAEKKIQEVWDERTSWPIGIVLNSAAASARNPEVQYQLALCSQEQAEQLQARLDLEARTGAAPHPRDVEKARSDWQNALQAWKRFDEDYTNHPDRAAARRLRGRAEAMLGDAPAAIASWKNVADYPTDLEKIASLYLAQQWEKHPKTNSPRDARR